MLTLIACASCQSALGECALDAACAASLPPVMAWAACTSIHRMVEHPLIVRRTTLNAYLAFVLLGNARSEARRRQDYEALAEIIR